MASVAMRLALTAVWLLTGCGSSSLTNPPDIAAAIDSEYVPNRLVETKAVAVTLDARAPDSFNPIIFQRSVLAEPIIVTQRSYSEARYVIDGIDVVHLLDSCDSMREIDAELIDCRVAVREELLFGPVEAAGITDVNGQVVLQLTSNHYRLSVDTVPTAEDYRCHWSGSVIVAHSKPSVLLPMLVHCESE